MSGRDHRSRLRLPLLVAALVAAAVIAPAAVKAASPSPSTLGLPAAAYTPTPPAGSPAPGSGAAIFAANCSGCHGPLGQGQLGPPLEPDGAASLVDGMVTRGGVTGGMPSFAHPRAILTPQQIAAVAAYVSSTLASPEARQADQASGGVLYRLYCSGCHGETGRGGALTHGARNAPSLARYPAAEALAAMMLGRGDMPVFAGTAFDTRQQTSVALYVEVLENPPSPGGAGLGFVGPVTEGLASFVCIGLLLAVAIWLAWRKSDTVPRRREGDVTEDETDE